jgi:hypothetical protein
MANAPTAAMPAKCWYLKNRAAGWTRSAQVRKAKAA